MEAGSRMKPPTKKRKQAVWTLREIRKAVLMSFTNSPWRDWALKGVESELRRIAEARKERGRK
jgi:hypothetical protein